MKKLLVIALIGAFAGFAWLSLPSPEQAQAPGTARKIAGGSGALVGVDRKQGVVTISHGPLAALNMYQMTASRRASSTERWAIGIR